MTDKEINDLLSAKHDIGKSKARKLRTYYEQNTGRIYDNCLCDKGSRLKFLRIFREWYYKNKQLC